jgi:hypothetical protein
LFSTLAFNISVSSLGSISESEARPEPLLSSPRGRMLSLFPVTLSLAMKFLSQTAYKKLRTSNVSLMLSLSLYWRLNLRPWHARQALYHLTILLALLFVFCI